MVTVLNANFGVENCIKHGGQIASVAGIAATSESLPEAKITISAIANRDYPQ